MTYKNTTIYYYIMETSKLFIYYKIINGQTRYILYMEMIDYFSYKKTNEDHHIELFNNMHRQFLKERYLIRMKELLLKNNQFIPNVIKDNIIQFL